MFPSFRTGVLHGCGSNISECLIASPVIGCPMDYGAGVISDKDNNSPQIKGSIPFPVLPDGTGVVFDNPGVYYQDSGRGLIFCTGIARSIDCDAADVDIDAPEAWEVLTGSSRVTVAVVYMGVDYCHPDLVDSMVGGSHVITGTPDPVDVYGHGYGPFAGDWDIGAEVTGKSKIKLLTFLNSGDSGYTSNLLESFTRAYAYGARLFSNSWRSSGTDYALHGQIPESGMMRLLIRTGRSGYYPGD